MTKVHWVIEDDLCEDNKDHFKDVCENFTEVSYLPFVADTEYKIKGFTNNSRDCVVCYGSVNLIQKLQRKYPYLVPNSYANFPNYDCAKYYPHFLDYLLNDHSYILPFGTIMKRLDKIFDWFETEDLFMRPTKGSKTFTGKVFDCVDGKEMLKVEQDCYGITSDELVLIAPAKNLGREWRLVIVDNEVVSGSLYRENHRHKEESGFPDHVKEFANEILANVKYRPDPAFVMDIGERPHEGLKLIELNSFSCSGMYACDLKPIVEAIESIAYRDWDDFYGNKN